MLAFVIICIFVALAGGSVVVDLYCLYTPLHSPIVCGGVCVWSLFCNAVPSVPSRFAIISLRKRELFALLCSCCHAA